MKTIVHLNVTERKEIQNMLRSRDGQKVLHAISILLLASFSPKYVAQLLGFSLSYVYGRSSRYVMKGVESFGHSHRSGRPTEWQKSHDELLCLLVESSPREYGYATNLWTCKLLSKTLLKLLGHKFSSESVRLRLKHFGYCWKRPKHAPAQQPDPEREEKLAQIELAKIAIESEPNSHLLHVDGADFNLLSAIRASWSPKGKQALFPTPGKNQKIYALGSIEPKTKRFLFQVSYRKRSKEFIAFVQHLLKRYRGKLYLILDNVRTQKSASVQRFVEEHKERLKLLYIPLYSPQYNQPIERAWGTCRNWVNGNESCQDMSELRRKTISGLRRFQTITRLENALI